MGTLVFQATLGGQVNLTGPNTASTFTISVPAVTGTMITSGDTATVTSTMISGPITTAKGGTGLTSFTANGIVYASSTSALATGSALTFDGSLFGVTNSSGTNVLTLLQNTVANRGTQIQFTNLYGTAYVGQAGDNTGSMIAYNGANAPWIFSTNATERMRLDASGNLGLGVTPSAWSTGKAFEIGHAGNAIFDVASSQLTITQNAYYNAGYKYGASTTASRYDQGAGSHIWYNAPSGTAGNAITFTQAMTLNASGQLLLGTTNATTNLTIGNGGGGNDLGVLLSRGAITNFYQAYDGTKTFIAGVDASNDYIKIGSLTSYPVGFVTGNSERMRIDTSGNLLVGTTSNVNAGKTTIAYSGAANNGLSLSETANTSGCTYIGFYQGSSVIANISRVGATSAVVYSTTSDYRLKTVIGPVSDAGQRIDTLQPVEYTWNSDGSHTRGFLAHKFQEVYPSSVTGTKDAVDADGKPVYQAMQSGTSEVIADLVAEIQSLRKRLTALEGKA